MTAISNNSSSKYDGLIEYIDENINTNGQQKITGAKMNSALKGIVAAVEAIDQDRDTDLTAKMGCKVLTTTKTLAAQMTDANTIYEVRDEFNMNSQPTLTLPANCRLKFDGGIIRNATIVANDTLIVAKDEERIFDNTTISGTLKNWYVTPEWFGAVKDHSKTHTGTDTTDAMQLALDCGKNVKLANNGGAYRITDTLHITNVYQVIYRDICNIGTNSEPRGAIYFEPEEDDSILFSIDDGAHDVYFNNLRIIAPNFSGTLFSCIYDEADKDIAIKDCQLLGGKVQIDFTGRGIELSNNMFYGCDCILRANWDDDNQTASYRHPAQGGQRAIRIQNNRMHAIGNDRNSTAIFIESGHAIGMVIQNNVWDNGQGGKFLAATDELWNLIFTDNLIQLNGLYLPSATVQFFGGIDNSIVADNNISPFRKYLYNEDDEQYEWVDYWHKNTPPYESSQSYADAVFEIRGYCRNTVFENNKSLYVYKYGFHLIHCTVESSRFIGNTFSFYRQGQDIGNSYVFYFDDNPLYSGDVSLGLNNSIISGNVSWDMDEGKNSFLISTRTQFNAYNNVVEYNKVFKQDGTLVASPFGGNVRLYNSVVSLENGITTSNDMSNFIKTFNPWPVSNGGVVSWFDGTKWMDALGYPSGKHRGAASEKPTLTASDKGYPYYNETNGKWECWSGTAWTNIDGTTLS